MRKRNICIAVICLFVIFMIANVVTYSDSGVSLVAYFFKNNNAYVANEMLNQNKQSYIIDEYTIELEESLFEEKTQIGYMVFSISKSNGKTEADLNSQGQCSGFGENNRFEFDFNLTGSVDKTFEYDGDVLYAYVTVIANEFSDENESEDKITVIDHQGENSTGDENYAVYSFDTEPEKRCIEYTIDGGEMYVSPLGIKIYSKNKLKDIEIEIKYADGDKETVVNTDKNIGTGSSGERERSTEEGDEYIYTFIFEDIKYIDKIEKVYLNKENLNAQN